MKTRRDEGNCKGWVGIKGALCTYTSIEILNIVRGGKRVPKVIGINKLANVRFLFNLAPKRCRALEGRVFHSNEAFREIINFNLSEQHPGGILFTGILL